MSRIGKSKGTESRLVVARGWKTGQRGMITNGYGGSFGGDKSVLEIDWGVGCTVLYNQLRTNDILRTNELHILN